jgi:ferredoxin
MKELVELARKLLTEGTVKVVIGYEAGPRGARPAFVTDPAQADRLVFDERCVQNLASYLSPRRSMVTRMGRAAVVVKGCDARAVAGLIRETQLKREDVVVIGVRCNGVKADPDVAGPLTAETVADRCRGCDVREPKLADHLVGALGPGFAGPSLRDRRIEEMDARPFQERWDFWTEELAKCVRCHACRQVCPTCFCERCLADKTRPQWLESSPHARGNLAWHVARAMHQAGRCVDCGECERACPVGIPLNLLQRKVAAVVAERFGYRTTDDPAVPAPIGTWRADDPQEFIL